MAPEHLLGRDVPGTSARFVGVYMLINTYKKHIIYIYVLYIL